MTLPVKTLLFTLVAPGTLAGVVPTLVRGPRPFVALGEPWRVAVGWVALAAGAAVYAWCAWAFVALGRGTPSPTDPPRELVARGLYRWSRNPMYVGVVLAVLGQAALAASAGVLAYAAVLALGFHLRVLMYEEPVLRKTFGDAYDGYVARVPRWFGRRTMQRERGR